MEGNACYKFSTIRNYIQSSGAPPVRLMIDVGANVGDISLMMHAYFPDAHIHAMEAVREYYKRACERAAGVPEIRVFHRAVTAEHVFEDDLGERPRRAPAAVGIWKAVPEGGPGWLGGSQVLPLKRAAATSRIPGYEYVPDKVRASTLDQVVSTALRQEKAKEIDVLKIDCEGCEHSTLGCASPKTLSKIRFIVGEYHGIDRFHSVMAGKLFQTHKVNLIGERDLGAFFAERLDGEKDGILRWDKSGMLELRPWLAPVPLDWHVFNDAYVLPEDRYWHALP